MTARYEHRMAFGASLLPSGAVRFSLWAPGADKVTLCLEPGGKKSFHPMPRRDDGWFILETHAASRGSCYSFQLDSGLLVPDPASRFQPSDVHGPSEVIDPADFSWPDCQWHGRPWEEAVLYEMHVGTFSAEGTFAAAQQRLDHLVELGITAIELMPVAAFPGRCNWGYDGVLPFAPDSSYGRPEDLKRLVAAAHAKNIMVLLDVVYNHFGPEGNYLHCYAPPFFTERYQTPWGAAINFDGNESPWVRQFFIDNALYWLTEYHFDGLRLDAVHAIHDRSRPDILEELAMTVRAHFTPQRHIHLILENDSNQAHYLKRSTTAVPLFYTAQWNDDLHHALHVLLTGEKSGYYLDYAESPIRHLGRCLTEGFAYQGEPSLFRNKVCRGEASRELPSAAFVSFLQNHDQIGNRAFGDRINLQANPQALRAALALLLLAPAPPLLFMGEEWGSRQPFPFFCDFSPEITTAVRDGRHREFAGFPEFSTPESRARIPDPATIATFLSAKLDWQSLDTAEGAAWYTYYRLLLGLRRQEVIPRLRTMQPGINHWQAIGESGLMVRWSLQTGEDLLLFANLGRQPCPGDGLPDQTPFFASHDFIKTKHETTLPPWSVFWLRVEPKPGGDPL
ncbi:MAG: malto-oligosyltrehalose trehalohydrolase [Desulfobulbus sp.]